MFGKATICTEIYDISFEYKLAVFFGRQEKYSKTSTGKRHWAASGWVDKRNAKGVVEDDRISCKIEEIRPVAETLQSLLTSI